jgi:hypothetical protein
MSEYEGSYKANALEFSITIKMSQISDSQSMIMGQQY